MTVAVARPSYIAGAAVARPSWAAPATPAPLLSAPTVFNITATTVTPRVTVTF